MFLNESVGGERQESFRLGGGELPSEETRRLMCLLSLTDWAGGAGVPEGGEGRGTWRAGTPLRLREGAGLRGASRRDYNGGKGRSHEARRGRGGGPERHLAARALAGVGDGYLRAPYAPPRT